MPQSWSLFALLAVLSLTQALQFCHVESKRSDLCFAVTSYKNETTEAKEAKDLSIHFSARFEDRNGWAAIGVGKEMKGALMVVMYPGEEDGDVTISIRTAPGHIPPEAIATSSNSVPSVHVTRTWVSPNGLHNAQVICYDCESWTRSELDGDSSKQKWIWSTNVMQNTRSKWPNLRLNMHTDRGIATLNMESGYQKHPLKATIAQVSDKRITINEPSKKEHHKHKTFGLVSIHGFLLAICFTSLSGGILAIRSGITKAFKIHWVVQSMAGGGIVMGCLMGFGCHLLWHGGHFSTFHQIIGLAILPAMIAQGLLGYWHHMNYVKLGRRTFISDYHVWVGRAVLLLGNVNIGLGLKLAHASSASSYLYFGALMLQLTILGTLWYFWSKGLTMMDVVQCKGNLDRKSIMATERGGVQYASVEQDPFIIDDDDVDEDLDAGV